MKRLITTAALAITTLFPSGASAVGITFDNGVITITEEVTFKITTAMNWSRFDVVIEDAYGTAPSFDWTGVDFSGSLPFSVNNITSTTGSLYNGNIGLSSNDVKATDFLLFGTSSTNFNLEIGDIVTLGPGTYTSSSSNPAFPNGNYNMFLTNGNFRISENGVTAVPEPSTWMFLGAGAVGLAVSLRRKQLAKQAA